MGTHRVHDAASARTLNGAGSLQPMVRSAARPEVGSHLGGSPLPAATQDLMETRFGVDFSSVRVHTDSRAAGLNGRLRSNAFTYGDDVFFDRGQYDPTSRTGRQLLAHELSHTIQQRKTGPVVQCQPKACPQNEATSIRSAQSNASGYLANAITRLEKEAEAILSTAERMEPGASMPSWVQARVASLNSHLGLTDHFAERNIDVTDIKREDFNTLTSLIADVVRKLRQINVSISFDCEDTCSKAGEAGNSNPGSGQMTICRDVYGGLAQNQQDCVALHEAVHASFEDANFDVYVGTGGYPPAWDRSLSNADSLTNLVADMNPGAGCAVAMPGQEVDGDSLSPRERRRLEAEARRDERRNGD